MDLYEPEEMTSGRTHGLPFRRIEFRGPSVAHTATGKHRKLIQERLAKIGYRVLGTLERGSLKPRGEWEWRGGLWLAQQKPGKEISGRVSQMERPFFIGPGPDEPVLKARGVTVIDWPRGRPKGPKGNPYPTKGQVTLRGRGTDRDHYSYRGQDFDVARAGPPPPGHSRSPHWVWTAAGKGDVGVRGAPTRDAAIERLRLWIDRSIYYAGLPEPEADAFFTLEGEVMSILEESMSPSLTTRAHVARRLKQERDNVRIEWQASRCPDTLAAAASRPPPTSGSRKARRLLKIQEEAEERCEGLQMREQGFAYFDSLPLADRLAWIDSHVQDHRLAFGLPAGPTKKNPRGKKKSKKDRRKLLSKLLRGA